ncbi:polar-amino-acid-transporting ATPase [Flavobacteriaceae bacterium UJ101]|nr:polar-amino-acid-transporting ATPase [Flavobacteriaceae bacterium UJ101]
MILAKNIHKYFNDLHVLKGVDLEIKKSEVVSIVGSSGAGKTTLLQILGTLDRPSKDFQESIIIDQTEVTNLSEKKLAKFRNENIGFIFQFHQLLPEFNALENVCLPGMIAGKSKRQLEKDALELLDYLGVSHRKLHKPTELSGGEQQRVAIARALINKPKVIFADEPSGNLDSKNADDLHQLFFDLRDQFKQTFVIVTHNEKLADLTDRKLVMKDGVII